MTNETYIFRHKIYTFLMGAGIPLIIFSLLKLINDGKNPDLIMKFQFWGAFLILISGATVFACIRQGKTYYIYKIEKFATASGKDMVCLTDLMDLFQCGHKKAHKIALYLVECGYFLDATYDAGGGILILSRESAHEYFSLVRDSNGKRLSSGAIRSRTDIMKIQVAARDYQIITEEYKEAFPEDKETRKIMKKINKFLTLIPRAMTYNMENNIDVRKIYSYYVPTLCKTIDNFIKLSAVSVSPQNKLKQELTDTLLQTCAVLADMCQELNKNDETDISVELSTMQVMLSASGYGRTNDQRKEDDNCG